MATLPTITCRAAFGQAFTNGSPTWTDISAYFRRASTRRGRSRLQRNAAQFQAGTATVALDNRDRRFDPTNTASPYYPNVKPGVLVNLRATWSGTTYDLFTGYVDNWPVRWPGRAEAETEVTVTDLFGILSKRPIINARYGTTVLTDSPKGYWKLNDPSGSDVAKEYTTNNFAGRVGTGVTFGSAGLLVSADAAASFTGTNQGIVADATITGTGDLTVEAWVRLGAISPSASAVIFEQLDWTTTNGVLVSVTPAGFLEFRVTSTSGAGQSVVTSSAVLADGLTHHVVCVRSGLTMLIYVDGVNVLNTTQAVLGTAPSGVVQIGSGNIGTALPFVGTIAHVAYYPSALSATRVAAHYVAGLPFLQQTTGARINAVLDAIGFPSSMRRIDNGRTIVPIASSALSGTTSLAYMQACETAEQGQLLVGTDGYVEFHDRYDRYNSGSATSVATFGDGGGELGFPVGAFNIDYDTVELYNTVSATRTGGATQTVSDTSGTTGIDAVGERVAPGLSDLMLTADQDALYLAQWILADTKQPNFRVDSLNLDPRGDSNLWPQVLGRVINDVITANKHTVPGGGAAISLPSRIEGVDHTFGDLKWQTVFHLSQMGATSGWMIFDDPTSGIMNGTNRFGW